MPKRSLEGIVTSAKSKNTAVVSVKRVIPHPRYKKTIKVEKKFHAHFSIENVAEGDLVRIQETRPISKLKRWTVKEIIKKREQE